MGAGELMVHTNRMLGSCMSDGQASHPISLQGSFLNDKKRTMEHLVPILHAISTGNSKFNAMETVA